MDLAGVHLKDIVEFPQVVIKKGCVLMGDIFKKAQQEQAKGFYQEILDKLEGLPANTHDWRGILKNAIDDIIQSGEQPPAKKDVWDFSREKSLPVFACDNMLSIRPITADDNDFYRGIRMQYSLMYRSAYYAAREKKSLFLHEALSPQVFYCIIEDSKEKLPLGYLGIKDTSADLWEIAIELDEKHTRQGFGPKSIRLYLNEVQHITGRTEFKAVVEVDNIPSQKCFERLGADLVGLCDSVVLKTDDEKERFEERHLELIDAHMIELSERLGVEPRKLLSHVLDY